MMENSKMMIFENPEFGQVRSTLIDGEPWFVAADVCRALEIDQVTNAVRKLDDDEKRSTLISIKGGKGAVSTKEVNIISESGLYSLVLGSRKPEAKAFKRWITHEVIPSIRKHGVYVSDAVIAQMEDNPELISKYISEYIKRIREERDRAKAAHKELEKKNSEIALLAPKSEYYDSFIKADDLTCLRYTAKELGVPPKKFIGYLLDEGYVFRDRHRDGRLFARAGERNDSLFMTRDFYTRGGRKSEYTLVTPEGKAYFSRHADLIRLWKEKEVPKGELITDQAVFAE